MRSVHLLAFALLATAAWADSIQPCQLQTLGSGVVCTQGILTFSLISTAPPETMVEPIPGGLALVGEMDGSGGGTFISLTVTVPSYWAIVGGSTVKETAHIIDVPTIFGIVSFFDGYAEDGTLTTHQTDFINDGEYLEPCLACGITSYFNVLDDPFFGGATNRVSLTSRTFGGGATVERWAIGGFDAVAPEPSAFLLLATALAAGLLAAARIHWPKHRSS